MKNLQHQKQLIVNVQWILCGHINLTKVRESDFSAKSSQDWSDFVPNCLKSQIFESEVRFSWHNQYNILPLRNVFPKTLALGALEFKFEFVWERCVPI